MPMLDLYIAIFYERWELLKQGCINNLCIFPYRVVSFLLIMSWNLAINFGPTCQQLVTICNALTLLQNCSQCWHLHAFFIFNVMR